MSLGEEASRDVAAHPSRQSASEYVARRVIDLVRHEALQPGDRLPTVQAMAHQFGVAQPTMRESLRLLQAVNFVEIRHGSGVYLKRPTAALVLPNPHPGELTPTILLDLFDARLLIEPHLAGLASQNASDDDLLTLSSGLDRASLHLQGEDQLLGCLNMDFHRRVALISGSILLAQIMDSLVDVYNDEQLIVMRLYDDRLRDHKNHLNIMAAIESRNPVLAERRMRSHLKLVRDVVAARMAENARQTAKPTIDALHGEEVTTN